MDNTNVLDKLITPQKEEIEKFVDGIRAKRNKSIECSDTNNTSTIRKSMNEIIGHHKKITQEYRTLSSHFLPMDVNYDDFKDWFEIKKQIDDHMLLSLQLSKELDDMFNTMLKVI